MVVEALDRDRNHLAGSIEGPGTADLFRIEGIVFGTMAIYGFDVAAALLCPQTMSKGIAAGEQAGEEEVGRNTHVNLRFRG